MKCETPDETWNQTRFGALLWAGVHPECGEAPACGALQVTGEVNSDDEDDPELDGGLYFFPLDESPWEHPETQYRLQISERVRFETLRREEDLQWKAEIYDLEAPGSPAIGASEKLRLVLTAGSSQLLEPRTFCSGDGSAWNLPAAVPRTDRLLPMLGRLLGRIQTGLRVLLRERLRPPLRPVVEKTVGRFGFLGRCPGLQRLKSLGSSVLPTTRASVFHSHSGSLTIGPVLRAQNFYSSLFFVNSGGI